jgi:hypothetical protein
MGTLDWWQETRADLRVTTRTLSRCKGWIENHELKLDLGVAVEDERLNFAATSVIGRWFDRLGVILSSADLGLTFSFDETMLAANLRWCNAIVALD